MELAIINGTYRDSSTKITATGKANEILHSQNKRVELNPKIGSFCMWPRAIRPNYRERANCAIQRMH